jgi:hypothetical protein
MRWKGVPGAKHPRQAIASAAKVSRLDERPASIATGSGFYSLPPIGQIVFTLKNKRNGPREASRQIHFIQSLWSEYMKIVHIDND